MKNKIYIGGAAILIWGYSAMAMAGACDTTFTKQIKRKMEQQAVAECNNPAINTNNTLTMADGSVNPYVYQNPDAGCDLGFKLPGLSGSGMGLNGDSCGILKSVTGDMVSKVNQASQGAVDSVLNKIPGGTNTIGGVVDTIGGLANGQLDINGIQQIGGAAVGTVTGTTDVNRIVTDAIKMN